MAIIDQLVNPSRPAACFLWPGPSVEVGSENGLSSLQAQNKELLVFQYWPASLQDDYQVEYAEHNIPGGTHPLYQWVGGRGRTISFQAVFTSEINTTHATLGARVPAHFTPSRQYTVDIAAAVQKIQAWMRPKYGDGGTKGETSPPKMLKLAFPGTKLGGQGSGSDVINVILRNAPVTYEGWFPNGQPRYVVIDLTFSEIVQSGGGVGGRSKVKFIDRTRFENGGKKYKAYGNASMNNPLIGGF